MAVNSIFSYFQSFFAGDRLVDGGECKLLTQMLFGTKSIVALAGGGAPTADAQTLIQGINILTTVATDADSVLLPNALPGMSVVVDNEGAHSATIFASTLNPATGVADSVVDNNSLVLAASVAVASGYAAVFYCTKVGVWKKLVSA